MSRDSTFRLVPDRTALTLAILGILFPILVTYSIALRTSINIPHLDDYHAALQFINIYSTGNGVLRHLGEIVTWQHNQYKLMFENAVFVLDYDITGHLNYALLGWLGNLLLLPIAYLLWKVLRPAGVPLAQRLLLFVPIALLFFAPQYDENINWAMDGLMHHPAILFAILTILLLDRNRTSGFALACVSLLLDIAASGNGFFLALVGLGFLLQRRRLRWAIVWSIVTLAMAAVYAAHFHPGFVPDRPPIPHPFRTLLLYPFAFVGASGMYVTRSTLAGLTLVPLFFLLLWRRGGLRSNPVPGYIGLFILITAAGVAVTRHTLGLYTSMAPRYRMYSVVFIILVYILAVDAAVDLAARRNISVRRFTPAFALFTLVCLAFNLRQDRFAAGTLWQRKMLLICHLQRWTADPANNSVAIDDYAGLRSPEMLLVEKQSNLDMRYAIDHHLYIPPSIPPDIFDHDFWSRHRPALKTWPPAP